MSQRRKIRRNFIRLQLFSDKLVHQDNIDSSKEQSGTQAQAKYSPHSIDVSRPKPDTSGYCSMSAPFGTGTFGGLLTPFGFIEYMAGAKVKKLNARGIIKMEALRHPSFDKFKLVMYAVYCPNKRVWADADAFVSQKKHINPISVPSVVPYTILPLVSGGQNFYVSSLPGPTGNEATSAIPWYISTSFRDTIYYAYYGRPAPIYPYTGIPNSFDLHSYNILPIRQYNAIINDIFLDRTTEAPYLEWNSTIPSTSELSYLFTPNNSMAAGPGAALQPYNVHAGCLLKRASTQSHYWNNFRSTIFKDNTAVDNSTLQSHNVTQQMIDEYRLQSQTEALSDQEIIAILRGTRVASEDRARIIGQKTVDIDISLQPNTAETVGGLRLGDDGAISYTALDIDFFDGYFEAPRDGYIHYLYHVVAVDDGIMPEGQNIEVLKTSWKEFYRPALEAIKDRAVQMREIRHSIVSGSVNSAIVGFTDNYSEYFRHPKFIRGDYPMILSRQADMIGDDRSDLSGWHYSYYTSDGTNYSRSFVPTKADWHALRPEPDSQEAFLPVKKNYSDYALHKLLFNRGPNIGNFYGRQLALPQTFSIYGSLTAVIDQPISRKLKKKFIPFGEA